MAQLQATVDKLVTQASRGLFQKDSQYVSELIFPEITVKQTTGLIGKYGKSHLRIVNSLMGGRGTTPRVHVDAVDSDSYSIEKHGLSDLLTEEDFDNFDKPFDARVDLMNFLMSRIWLGKEKAIADALGSTTILTQNTTLSGTNQWNDYNNSDPLDDIKTARHAVRDGCGIPPRNAILEWKVFDTLRYHPAILENLGYTRQRAGKMSHAEMASALDLDSIYVPSVVYNSSAQGQADSLAALWGKNFVLYHTPKKASLREQSLGYYIKRKEARKVFVNSVIDPPESELVQVIDNYDYVIADATCGYLIKSAIA